MGTKAQTLAILFYRVHRSIAELVIEQQKFLDKQLEENIIVLNVKRIKMKNIS
jgi:hypothetical protein